jgi:hypothetical protein
MTNLCEHGLTKIARLACISPPGAPMKTDKGSDKPKVTITFPSTETRDSFMVWLSDGGGEQQFFDASALDDESPIEAFNYEHAFKSWGYDPEKHGEPVIHAEY